ncbi:MAG: hypothetical protein Q9169_004079 [Polycauliona sp. 2 TL-2023]
MENQFFMTAILKGQFNPNFGDPTTPTSSLTLGNPSTSPNMLHAHLLALPNEILFQIVAYLIHDDLENFSSSCKRTEHVSAEAMTLHLERKYQYACAETFNTALSNHPFKNKAELSGEKDNVTFRIIKDALENEGILGGYVRKLTLRDNRLSDEGMEVLRSMILSRGPRSICHPAIGAECECLGCLWYSRTYNDILLLACTRLKSLELLSQSADATVYGLMGIHNRHSPTVRSQPKALESLQHVSLGRPNPKGKRDERNAVAWDHVYPFARLPSIHSIRVYNLLDKPTERHPLLLTSGITSLAKLEMFNSLITADGLTLFLEPSTPNSLTHFQYEVNPGPDHKMCQYDWDPRSIVRVLRQHTLQSLTHLTIVGSPHNNIMGQRRCGGFIGPLVQFTQLQHVQLECYMLIFKRRYNGKPILSADEADDDYWGKLPTQPILELFPPSLETLKIIRRGQADVQIERMLKGLDVVCPTLPRLREVVGEDKYSLAAPSQPRPANFYGDKRPPYLRKRVAEPLPPSQVFTLERYLKILVSLMTSVTAEKNDDTPTKQLYQSTPLPAGSRCVRVLDVQPAMFTSDRLFGNLRVIDLDATPSPSFAALSYVWGAMQDATPTSTITCGPGDVVLQLTNNCYEALINLRAIYQPLTIWVDAICIDQEEDAEKNHQLPLMGEIYGRAIATYIWFGPSNESCDRAMTCLSTDETMESGLGYIPKALELHKSWIAVALQLIRLKMQDVQKRT